MKLILLMLFFLCNTLCLAQENITIEIRDQDKKPLPFFTIENIKFNDFKYFGDSLGNVTIPYINGMAYKIHAIGFIDSIFTIQQNENLSFVLRSDNILDEVVVKPTVFSTSIKELKSERVDQADWLAGLPDNNNEIGRIVIFDKNIWIHKAIFKITSWYNLDFKKHVFLNIYKVNEELENELVALKTKKPWTYKFSAPDLIFSSHLNDNYDVFFENKDLTFDISRLGIYLDKGKYIITMELMAGRTIGIRPYFSRQKECLMLTSRSNAKRIGWSFELAHFSKKYANIIADFTYCEQVK